MRIVNGVSPGNVKKGDVEANIVRSSWSRWIVGRRLGIALQVRYEYLEAADQRARLGLTGL